MSDEVLSPDEQIIRDMGDEMNEIRVGRAKAYFQIRQLRTQLAERDRRIGELEAELVNWKEKYFHEEDMGDDERKEHLETREKLKKAEAERDELIKEFGEFKQEQREYRDKMLTKRDELKRQLAAERKQRVEAEAERDQARTEWSIMSRVVGNWRTFPGQPESDHDHPDWTVAARAILERAELQRKLDACQCETRVLGETMLIEAEKQRDQARAERDNLRVMFNDSQIVLRSASRRADDAETFRRQAERERDQLAAECGLLRDALIWASAADDFSPGGEGGFLPGKAREGFEKIVLPALAATPHAAKAAERVEATADVVRATRELTANFESRTYRSPHHGDGWEAIKHEVQLREQLRKALDRLDALDKPEVQE